MGGVQEEEQLGPGIPGISLQWTASVQVSQRGTWLYSRRWDFFWKNETQQKWYRRQKILLACASLCSLHQECPSIFSAFSTPCLSFRFQLITLPYKAFKVYNPQWSLSLINIYLNQNLFSLHRWHITHRLHYPNELYHNSSQKPTRNPCPAFYFSIHSPITKFD